MLRTVSRWTVTIALVASALVGLYFIAAILFRRWALVLFLGYSLGALASFVFSAYWQARALKTNLDILVWSAAGAAALQQSSFFNRSRSHLARHLTRICATLTWPAVFLGGALRVIKFKGVFREQDAILLRQLGADDLVYEPAFMLSAITVATGLASVSEQPRGYFVAFAWIAVAYVVGLCLAMIFLPGALAQRVRRGSGKPYVKALAVAGLSVCIAVLGFAMISSNGRVSWAAYIQTARSLYSQLDSIKELLAGRDVSTISLAQGAVGALLASATIQGLLSLKDFQRTDEDLIVIARAKALLGKPSAALTTLESIRNHSASSLALQAVCFIGVEQLDRALDAWRRRTALLSANSKPSNEEELRTLLTDVSVFPFSEDAYSRLYELWLSQSPSPEWMTQVSLVLSNVRRVSPARLIASLRELKLIDAHPILATRLALASKDLADARGYAEQAQSTQTALEFVRVGNELLIGIGGPTTAVEDAAFFKSWCDKHLQALLALEPQADTYEKLLLAFDCVLLLRTLASQYGSANEEPLQFALDSLTSKLRKTAPDTTLIDTMLQHMVPRAFHRQHV